MTPAPHRVLKPGMHGDDVYAMQDAANHRLNARGEHEYKMTVDGKLGEHTIHGCSRALYVEGVHGKRFRQSKTPKGIFDVEAQALIRFPHKRTRAMRLLEKLRMAKIRHERKRAHEQAKKHAGRPLGEGVDYAWGYRGGVAEGLRKAGKHFAMRYLSTPGNSKNLTQTEANALRLQGLGVGIVFETTANRALSGYNAGRADASSAQKQLFMTGLPQSTAIYFAVDFDATEGEQSAINGYLKGAASILGHDRVGVYGGYWVVKRALDAGVCKYAWQTYAWSGGQWDNRAHLQQYRNGVTVAGVSCDLTRAVKADAGICTTPLTPAA